MTKVLLSKGMLIAAAAAAAILIAVAAPTATAQTKKDAKVAASAPAPAPSTPGFCTASVNALKWGHMSWRTTGGQVIPTLAMCYEQYCPASC